MDALATAALGGFAAGAVAAILTVVFNAHVRRRQHRHEGDQSAAERTAECERARDQLLRARRQRVFERRLENAFRPRAWVTRTEPPIGPAPVPPEHFPAHGQGLAEYALILALIALVMIVALIFLGSTASAILSGVGRELQRTAPAHVDVQVARTTDGWDVVESLTFTDETIQTISQTGSGVPQDLAGLANDVASQAAGQGWRLAVIVGAQPQYANIWHLTDRPSVASYVWETDVTIMLAEMDVYGIRITPSADSEATIAAPADLVTATTPAGSVSSIAGTDYWRLSLLRPIGRSVSAVGVSSAPAWARNAVGVRVFRWLDSDLVGWLVAGLLGAAALAWWTRHRRAQSPAAAARPETDRMDAEHASGGTAASSGQRLRRRRPAPRVISRRSQVRLNPRADGHGARSGRQRGPDHYQHDGGERSRGDDRNGEPDP